MSLNKIKYKIFLYLGFIVLAFLLILQFSPWPKAMAIRYFFDKDAKAINEKIKDSVPKDIITIKNIQYLQNDADAFFDIYSPTDNHVKDYKTIVWIHGGAWISGSKDLIANYCKILASKGFNVIALDYSIAPEKKYPTALKQINAFFAYLNAHAKDYNLNTHTIILAGDSAGAQLAAQYANITVNTNYSEKLNIQPELHHTRLIGTILFCGGYDINTMNFDGEFGSFLQTVFWAYTGTKNFEDYVEFETISVINYLDSNFPHTFISVGNADPLANQSYSLYDTLKYLEVPVERLFFEEHYTPKLEHEYQFDIRTAAGDKALKRIVEFAKQL